MNKKTTLLGPDLMIKFDDIIGATFVNRATKVMQLKKILFGPRLDGIGDDMGLQEDDDDDYGEQE